MWIKEVGSAVWLAQILMEMRWAVMISDEPVFITTDSPVVPLHPELRFRGFKNPDTSVVLPLSPTRLLWLEPLPGFGDGPRQTSRATQDACRVRRA